MSDMNAVKALLIMLIPTTIMAQQYEGCPIDENGNQLNPLCPNIELMQQAYSMNKDGGDFKFFLNENSIMDNFLTQDDVINHSQNSYQRLALPYIPLLEDCNLPTSMQNPGPCDVEGSFEPYRVDAHLPQVGEESYLGRQIKHDGVYYHYSTEHISNPSGPDKLRQHWLGFEFKDATEYHLVLDYTHYRLESPPKNISVVKSSEVASRPGHIEIELDGAVLKGCNKSSEPYPYDASKSVIYIKDAPDSYTHLFHSENEFTIRQWKNKIFYELTTEHGIYGDPKHVICSGYLTDDIYKGGFEDEIFRHGFDDMPWRYYPPQWNVPPRP